MLFTDRHDAGRRLAERVVAVHPDDPVVLALPRGGVPVGLEIARALHAPLDLVLACKIGAPGQPELAIGAVADDEQPCLVLDEHAMRVLSIPPDQLAAARTAALREIERRRPPGRADSRTHRHRGG